MTTLRELIHSQNQWTQDAYARDARGNEVSPSASNACKWCLFGGCLKVSVIPADYTALVIKIKTALKRLFGRTDLVGWQDHATWEQVNQLLDEAGI